VHGGILDLTRGECARISSVSVVVISFKLRKHMYGIIMAVSVSEHNNCFLQNVTPFWFAQCLCSFVITSVPVFVYVVSAERWFEKLGMCHITR